MTYVTWREDFCRGGFRRLGLALRACSPICRCELCPRGPGIGIAICCGEQ